MEKENNIVYETTDLINGKTYLGVHSTNNLFDGYLGSGTALLRAIKKRGKENFSRRVIANFATREAALEYESMLVTTEWVKNSSNYNLTEGGKGQQKIGSGLKKKMAFGKLSYFEAIELVFKLELMRLERKLNKSDFEKSWLKTLKKDRSVFYTDEELIKYLENQSNYHLAIDKILLEIVRVWKR